MSNLKFGETHSLVAFLEKTEESNGFEGIIDFLNASSIKYALTVNPTIYTSCIKQFWATAKAKTVNGEVQIQALVDGMKVIVTEMSVRRALQLKDAEGTECLPNATIFAELERMRYENLTQKLTFYKALFSPQWKFLIHTILQCLGAKTTDWNEFSSRPSNCRQAPEELGEGLEIPADPQHTPTIIQPSTSQPQKKQPRRKQRKDTEVPQPSGSIEPITDEAANAEHVPTHSNDLLFSGEDRLQLKELRWVKKLERRNKSRTLGLKRLRKVGRSTQVVSSKDKGLGAQEDASKQGMKIDDLDVDTELGTAEVTTASATITTVNELTLAQTLIEIKAAKPKVVTTITTTTAVIRPKARGVKLAKQKEEDANIAEWDNVQAMIDADYELATILQAQEQEELIIEEWSKMYGYRVGKRELQEGRDGTRKQFKRAGEELESDNSKRKKLDESRRPGNYGGNLYTLVVVDDYSSSIIAIRTDHGWEFDNEVQFRAYCDAQGITHNFSAPRTPQSNGVVERKNRTLQEMSRTMLNEQSIPQKFWCNVVDTSTYILNRILIRPILGKTPYEIFRGRKPSLEYFKVFGSKCFILNTKDYLTKFDTKSYEGVFLGYSQNSKAYVVLNKHTMKVKESLNVTFDESPPPTKLSPLVDDDVGEEESIRKNAKIINTNNEEDESIEVDEIINIKESKNHPLAQVIGNLNQRTLRSQAQNHIELLLESSNKTNGRRDILYSMKVHQGDVIKSAGWKTPNHQDAVTLEIKLSLKDDEDDSLDNINNEYDG
ncbi:retrovirus-related pol polyprotein from transposon TNT 1-94 [Tanacetum coccineum]